MRPCTPFRNAITLDGKLTGLRLYTTDPLVHGCAAEDQLVAEAHASLIASTFSANEVEDLELFLERLSLQRKVAAVATPPGSRAVAEPAPLSSETLAPRSSNGPCQVECAGIEFHVTMIIDECDHPVGVAVHEVYLRSGLGLVTYVVVSPKLRGCGAATTLMEAAFQNCRRVIEQRSPPACPSSFNGLFVEVLQHAPGASEQAVKDNTARRQLFSKCGFRALPFDLVHPGRMKGGKYNLSIRPGPGTTASAGVGEEVDKEDVHVRPEVVLAFLYDLFAGILGDEGVDNDRQDYDGYARLLLSGADGEGLSPRPLRRNDAGLLVASFDEWR